MPPADEAARAMKAAEGASDCAERTCGAIRAADDRVTESTGPLATWLQARIWRGIMVGDLGRVVGLTESAAYGLAGFQPHSQSG